MLDWLRAVERVVESIPDTLSLLRQMLVKNPRNRITPSQLVSDLLATPWIKTLTRGLLAKSSSLKTFLESNIGPSLEGASHVI
jgi:hypothetical protein